MLTRFSPAIAPAPVAVQPVYHNFVPDFILREQLRTAEKAGDLDWIKAINRTLQINESNENLRRGKSASPGGAEGDVDNAKYEPDRDPNLAERYIYTANNAYNLPGTVLYREGEDASKATDVDVPALSKQMGDFLRFLKDIGAMNSIDNKYYDLHFSIHYGSRYNNAFWDSRQMVTGDGDGKTFTKFHLDEDVPYHEIGHGATEYNAGSAKKLDPSQVQSLGVDGLVYGGLEYYGESGALNESYSDIFAVLARTFVTGQRIKDMGYNDWLLGAKCMIGNNRDGTKSAIRNFDKKPGYDRADIGKDPQPKHMKDKYRGGGDNGGVHYNSGIINHAFFLAANKLVAANPDEKLNDALGPIWFKAQRNMHTKETFKEFASDILATAKEAYPNRPEVAKAIEEALTEVGVINQSQLTEIWWTVLSRVKMGVKVITDALGLSN